MTFPALYGLAFGSNDTTQDNPQSSVFANICHEAQSRFKNKCLQTACCQ
jgi:hypothetical protein